MPEVDGNTLVMAIQAVDDKLRALETARDFADEDGVDFFEEIMAIRTGGYKLKIAYEHALQDGTTTCRLTRGSLQRADVRGLSLQSADPDGVQRLIGLSRLRTRVFLAGIGISSVGAPGPSSSVSATTVVSTVCGARGRRSAAASPSAPCGAAAPGRGRR